MTVKFDCTKKDFRLIEAIVARAKTDYPTADIDYKSLLMDLAACHRNGCPLKLQAMLTADPFNFAHDVFGIYRHMDRRTGRLADYFLPRFFDSKKVAA